MTIKEIIEKLTYYPPDMKVFSFNHDDQMYYEGVSIMYNDEFKGVIIRDDANSDGYWYSCLKKAWVKIPFKD